jgi:hypothetical protein
VGSCEPFKNLAAYPECFFNRQCSGTLQPMLQGIALEVFHRQAENITIYLIDTPDMHPFHVKGATDVAVSYASSQPNFLPKLFHQRRAVRDFKTDGFDGYPYAQFGIYGFVNLAHTSGTEHALDLEASPEHIAGLEDTGVHHYSWIWKNDAGEFEEIARVPVGVEQ